MTCPVGACALTAPPTGTSASLTIAVPPLLPPALAGALVAGAGLVEVAGAAPADTDVLLVSPPPPHAASVPAPAIVTMPVSTTVRRSGVTSGCMSGTIACGAVGAGGHEARRGEDGSV